MHKKVQPYGTCTSGANAVRPHEMRAKNGATISPGAYNTTISWLDEWQQLVHSTPTLRHLHLWVVHCFARHGHCRIPCPKHGLLTECYSKPNVRQKARTCATFTPLQKVPVRNLTFHVMPRQRLYPDDFGQIAIFAWSLPGISWNA